MAVERSAPSFLDLPPEIRNMIYGYHFDSVTVQACVDRSVGGLRACTSSSIDSPMDSYRYGFRQWYRYPVVHGGIFRTCRQIHGETIAILYGKIDFHFCDAKSASRFLSHIGPALKHIRRVVIRCHFVVGLRSVLDQLTVARDLEYIQIYVFTWHRTIEPSKVARIDQKDKAAMFFKNFLLAFQKIKNDREAVFVLLRLDELSVCRCNTAACEPRCSADAKRASYQQWRNELKTLVFEYLVDNPAATSPSPDRSASE